RSPDLEACSTSSPSPEWKVLLSASEVEEDEGRSPMSLHSQRRLATPTSALLRSIHAG
ncbi:hypothetical protein LTR16_012171, partial [Cryomyces antarcticus]